jgi:hypothetical protein
MSALGSSSVSPYTWIQSGTPSGLAYVAATASQSGYQVTCAPSPRATVTTAYTWYSLKDGCPAGYTYSGATNGVGPSTCILLATRSLSTLTWECILGSLAASITTITVDGGTTTVQNGQPTTVQNTQFVTITQSEPTTTPSTQTVESNVVTITVTSTTTKVVNPQKRRYISRQKLRGGERNIGPFRNTDLFGRQFLDADCGNTPLCANGGCCKF